MKKVFKIIGLILLVIILLALGAYCYFTNFGRTSVFSAGTNWPTREIPITYNVGWWTNQEAISVDSLKIEIVESKLNLFNNQSLIAYEVSGQLTNKQGWKASIKEVHISERINLDTALHCDRIIEITPIVKFKEHEKLEILSERFKFRNEHTIVSNHWGINRIKFVCGQKEQVIALRQRK